MRSDRATICRKEAVKSGQSPWVHNLEEKGSLFQDWRKSMKWHYDRAEILADGEVIAESTTYAEFGSVIVDWVPQVGALEESPIEEDPPE